MEQTCSLKISSSSQVPSEPSKKQAQKEKAHAFGVSPSCKSKKIICVDGPGPLPECASSLMIQCSTQAALISVRRVGSRFLMIVLGAERSLADGGASCSYFRPWSAIVSTLLEIWCPRKTIPRTSSASNLAAYSSPSAAAENVKYRRPIEHALFLERELPGGAGKLLLACHAYHLKRRAMLIRAKLVDNDFRLVEAACGGYLGR